MRLVKRVQVKLNLQLTYLRKGMTLYKLSIEILFHEHDLCTYPNCLINRYCRIAGLGCLVLFFSAFFFET